jgi:hypothetical protein
MKKLLITLALIGATLPAMAQHHGYGHNHRHYGNYYRGPGYGGWVAPLIIGGAVGYALTRPEPVIVQQPVIVEQPPIVQNQNCGPWKEIQTSDGRIYRERTCIN